MQQDYWHMIEPFWDAINVNEDGEAYLASIADIPTALVQLHATHFAQSEICNGGFAQFFQNCGGVLAPEATTGFAAMGMASTAKLLAEASQMLGTPYPRDWQTRHTQLDAIPVEKFDRPDSQFYDLIETEADGFQRAANRFVQKLRQ
jgi:hypothetical protein